MRVRKVAIWLLLVSGAVDAADGCVAHSPRAVRTRVLELYTSEGCSSCPPADRWFSTIAPGAAILPLAFHVDYWDYIGWTDRYADPRHTARQRLIAARTRASAIYTPAVVLDGREYRNWSRGLPDAAPPTATGPGLTLEGRRSGGAIEARLTIDGEVAGSARVHFALAEGGLMSAVRAGENRGETLRHDHVVRALADAAVAPVVEAQLAVPGDLVPERAALVAWLEDGWTGATRQAVRLPLAGCR